MEARINWHNTFQVLKEKRTVNSEFHIQWKISFRNEEEIKAFSDEEKLREFITKRPNLEYQEGRKNNRKNKNIDKYAVFLKVHKHKGSKISVLHLNWQNI